MRAVEQGFLFGERITKLNGLILEDHVTLLNYIVMRSFDFRVEHLKNYNKNINETELEEFIEANKSSLIHLVRYERQRGEGVREQHPSHEVPVIREADDFLFLYETDCPKNKAANRKLGKHELTLPNWPKER